MGLFELKPNSEQLWKIKESNLTEYQQGEPDRQFWARFLNKSVDGLANFTSEGLEEARRRGYEEAKEKYKKDVLNETAKQIRGKANAYEKLREKDIVPFHTNLDDKYINRLESAVDFINKVDSDHYGSLRDTLDHLEKDIKKSLNDMLNTSRQLSKDIRELEEKNGED